MRRAGVRRPMRRLAALALALAAGAAAAQELAPWRGGAPPPLALADGEGRTHRLGDYRGRVVIVNFWAAWCEPCRDEMPSLQRLRNRMGAERLAVLAVNVGESPARIGEFLQKLPLDFTILRDHSSAAMKAWRVRALPASFVVDGAGRIRYSHTGEIDWEEARVVEAVGALLPRPR